MNPTSILALISDLYNQIARLSEENGQLRAQLETVPEESSD